MRDGLIDDQSTMILKGSAKYRLSPFSLASG
jgi:hypothetical protein